MKIALDAMGGDFGPPNLVAGAVMALREAWLEPTSPTGRRLQLLAFQRQDLSATVIAARWAGDVRWQAASALRTFVELRRVPAVCRFPSAQSHL